MTDWKRHLVWGLLSAALIAQLTGCAPAVNPPPPVGFVPPSGSRDLTPEEARAFARTLPVYRTPEEMIAGGAREREQQALQERRRARAEAAADLRHREEAFCVSLARSARPGFERTALADCLNSFSRANAFFGR